MAKKAADLSQFQVKKPEPAPGPVKVAPKEAQSEERVQKGFRIRSEAAAEPFLPISLQMGGQGDAEMKMPDYDTEVVVKVQADKSIEVNASSVSLAELAQRIDEVAAGRRVRLEVLVWRPQEELSEFEAFVKAVQAELRQARSPVVTGYHTQQERRMGSPAQDFRPVDHPFVLVPYTL